MRRPTPAASIDIPIRCIIFQFLPLCEQFLLSEGGLCPIPRLYDVVVSCNVEAAATFHHCPSETALHNVAAVVNRRCVLCHDRYEGGFDPSFGVYAHPHCVDLRLRYTHEVPSYGALMAGLPKVGEITQRRYWYEPHPAIPDHHTLLGRFMNPSFRERLLFEAESAIVLARRRDEALRDRFRGGPP
jgi:hypothetical protein